MKNLNKNKNKNKKDFLTLKDYSRDEIEYLIKLASKIKNDKKLYSSLLKGKSIALLFDKPSTRTRLSFEAAIEQLGGNCIYLDASNLQIKRGETLQDSARVFSGYLDGLVIRTFKQETVEIFAENSAIPVINGLTDMYHPCQALSDLFTLCEIRLLDKSLKFTYLGDCNNVLNSLLIGLSKLGIDITVGCSEKYAPSKEIMEYALQQAEINGSRINIFHDPVQAVTGSNVIYTDVWISMGDEDSEEKIKELMKFQVSSKLLSKADKNVRVMHCLPAHREQEITSDVLDGKNSIVWQQAENRLYAQKALLVYLFSKRQL
ncbi:MAG: ornithine carbamoyltransferase [Actinobacteria bacterium]|nr:ornithine carbamoyltransferase [Actinomycetota bacterium]MBM3712050.1 ornithine carbamoyltransferase [Actinomycetota bacterium]